MLDLAKLRGAKQCYALPGQAALLDAKSDSLAPDQMLQDTINHVECQRSGNRFGLKRFLEKRKLRKGNGEHLIDASPLDPAMDIM